MFRYALGVAGGHALLEQGLRPASDRGGAFGLVLRDQALNARIA
jgi:hypothetical protein